MAAASDLFISGLACDVPEPSPGEPAQVLPMRLDHPLRVADGPLSQDLSAFGRTIRRCRKAIVYRIDHLALNFGFGESGRHCVTGLAVARFRNLIGPECFHGQPVQGSA